MDRSNRGIKPLHHNRLKPKQAFGVPHPLPMKFAHACIESLALALPEEKWTSAGIEERLRPLYERLKLPAGRLELMTGIRERRMWPEGTKPSDASALAGRAVLKKSAIPAPDIEVLISFLPSAATCSSRPRPRLPITRSDSGRIRRVFDSFERLPRISQWSRDAGGDDRLRPDPHVAWWFRAKTAARWFDQHHPAFAHARRSIAMRSNRFLPISPSARLPWPRWSVMKTCCRQARHVIVFASGHQPWPPRSTVNCVRVIRLATDWKMQTDLRAIGCWLGWRSARAAWDKFEK